MRDRVFRTESGHWLAQHNGLISSVKSVTQDKARTHLSRLQSGLARLVPMADRRGFKQARSEVLDKVFKF